MAKDNAAKNAPAAEAAAETPATPAPSVHLEKKLSAKVICGTLAAPTEPKAIFSIYGIASSIKHGTSQFGEWTAFQGSFEAINYATQEKFVAGQCFLPPVVESLLMEHLAAAQKDDNTATVQFALEVGIKPLKRRDGSDSYEYTVRPLVPIQQNDALAHLRQAVTYQP